MPQIFSVPKVEYGTQPGKLNLNKKLDPKQKTSILMPKGSEKLEMKILPHRKKEYPANQCWPIFQPWADWLALVCW